MWHHLPQPQQRGAQIDPGKAGGRRKDQPPADAPDDAVAGREAQDHEQADAFTSPDGEPATGIDYPADPVERRTQDITADDPQPAVDWDTRVQPEERAPEQADDETRGD